MGGWPWASVVRGPLSARLWASVARGWRPAWLLAYLVLAAGDVRAEAGAGALRILMLGDSLTAGYGLASGDALPSRLEAALRDRGIDVRVIDAGVSGDTTAGGLARLEWALADRPHAVIVALGANDALRAIDPAVSRSNLDRLLRALAERRLPVLLAGMLAPRNLGPDYGAKFDAIYPEVAERHGALLHPFLLDGVATVAALNQADGLHPNAAGVEVIVERILPNVLCLVRRTDHPAAAAARLPLQSGSAAPRAGRAPPPGAPGRDAGPPQPRAELRCEVR